MDITATRKFAHDIVSHILILHDTKVPFSELLNNESLSNCPILYTNTGRYHVIHYFTNHKPIIKEFCESIIEKSKLGKQNFLNRMNTLIEIHSHYDQSLQVFYNLCIKLTLFGLVAMKKGQLDALVHIIEKIDTLATEAYLYGNLDEHFDCFYNFTHDLLKDVFTWCGCGIDMHWDLKKVFAESNPLNYVDFYESYFKKYFKKHGMAITNEFCAGLNQEKMTKQVFVFKIQDWCDVFYGQLGEVEPVKSLTDLLDILMKISLFSVYAVKLFYPCAIRIAQESMIKLGIAAEKKGLWSIDNQKKLKIDDSMEF